MEDKKVISEDKKEVVKVDTTNPFNKGVSYADFLENVNGKTTVDTLLKKHNITGEKSEWVKRELEIFKAKK